MVVLVPYNKSRLRIPKIVTFLSFSITWNVIGTKSLKWYFFYICKFCILFFTLVPTNVGWRFFNLPFDQSYWFFYTVVNGQILYCNYLDNGRCRRTRGTEILDNIWYWYTEYRRYIWSCNVQCLFGVIWCSLAVNSIFETLLLLQLYFFKNTLYRYSVQHSIQA